MRELLDTASRTAPCPACGAQEITHGFGPTCKICGSQLTRPGDSYLKHSFSWLLDLPVRVSYDDASRTVTLAVDEFDSVLIAGFVIHSLAPAGIVAFADETGEIRSPQVPWSLIYVLAGVSYGLKIVRQKEFSREGKIRVAARLVPL